MSAKRVRLFERPTWLLPLLSLLALVGIVGLQAAGCYTLIDPTQGAPAAVFGSVTVIWNGLGFSILGWLITVYKPENRLGWLLAVSGTLLVLGNLGMDYGGCSLLGPMTLPADGQLFWLGYLLGPVAVLFLLVGLPLLFPDGRFLSPRWAHFAQFALIWFAGVLLLLALWPGPLDNGANPDVAVINPYGLDWNPPAAAEQLALYVFPLSLVVVFALANVSLLLRWRRASADVRQQLKWLAYYLATVGTLVVAVELTGGLIYPPIFDSWFYLFVLSILWLGYPIVIGLVIFKYRLYDIDILIRKTLVYGLLTGALLLFYFGSVVLLQQLFTAISGQESPAAIVISTLAIYALFRPLRGRIQAFIDRRFYRRRYDASQTLADFAATARDEVDLNQLTAELVRVIQETMQPEQVGLWLASSEREKYLQVGGPQTAPRRTLGGEISHE